MENFQPKTNCKQAKALPSIFFKINFELIWIDFRKLEVPSSDYTDVSVSFYLHKISRHFNVEPF